MDPIRPGKAGIPPRVLFGGLAVAAWLVIGIVTMTPTPDSIEEAAATPLACLVCGSAGSVDVFWNILLFVPLGFALRKAGFSLRMVIGMAALTTLVVEAVQLFVVTGRDASLSDLLSNTIGGGAGAVLARALPSIWRPAPARIPACIAASTLAPLFVLAGSALMLQPSSPATLWYGHRAPDLGHFEQFQGSVDSAWIGDMELPIGPMRDLDTRRIRESGSPPSLGARFRSGPPTAGLAPIAFVSDQGHKVYLLGQDGRDLLFETRIRGEDFRFRPLGVVLRNGLPDRAGVSVRAWGEFDGKAVTIVAELPSLTRRRNLEISPSLGWVLAAPMPWPVGAEYALVSTAFLCVLWAPLGFYGAQLRRRGASGGTSILVLAALTGAGILTVGMVAAALHLSFGGWPDWIGPALGAAAGVGLGSVAARWPHP